MEVLQAAKDYCSTFCHSCKDPCRVAAMPTGIPGLHACGGLTRNLTERELALVAEKLVSRHISAGTEVVSEGCCNNQVFFLLSGEMSILKQAAAADGEYEISRLKKGDFFGELSWLDSQPASATVKACTECDVAIVPVKELAPDIQAKVAINIAQTVSRRLRHQNEIFIQSLVREAEELRVRVLFGRFYIITMVLFALVTLIPIYFNSQKPTDALGRMFNSWAALLLLLLPMIYFLRRAKLPASTFGLTLQGWRRALPEGAAVVLLLTAAMFMVRAFSKEPGAPFFSWQKMQSFSLSMFILYLMLYPIHSFLQELISRGVLQGALQIFLRDIHPLMPPFLVSILFGIAHLHHGVGTAALTFAGSMIMGAFYVRHPTLVGVTMVHFCSGVTAMSVGII